MGNDALALSANGKADVPTTSQEWDAWVSATATRNFTLGNRLIDWLERYGADAGFELDTDLRDYDERTDFTQFIMRKGVEFEAAIAAHLATQVRRDTALADELLERRVEHWPLLRLVYWPLGFLSRLVGSRLTGRGRRPETIVGEPFRIDGRPLADRIGLMRSRLLADHTAIASDLKLENEMPKDSYLAGRVEAATSRLIPELADHLLDGIRTRDRRPSIIGKMMLWLIALWFPILQPLLEGGLEMYLQDGRFAIVRGLYRIVSAFSAVHLLTGLAVVVIVFVALLAAMYARALRAVRLALDPSEGLDSSTQLAGFVEEILVNETVAPLVRPFQNHLRELEALRSRLDPDVESSD